jgi:hypothetical protein
MNSISKTDSLVHSLAQQAGRQRRRLSFEMGLLAGCILAALICCAVVLVAFGIATGSTPSVAWAHPAFLHKITSMLALAFGAIALVRAAGRPDAGIGALLCLVPGVALLVLGAANDTSGLSLAGVSQLSVPACVLAIVLLSLPAFAVLVVVLRNGVPTHPPAAGAAAGLLAGILAGAAYALICKNDGALFVAVWYSLAIAFSTGLGTLAGRRLLAW